MKRFVTLFIVLMILVITCNLSAQESGEVIITEFMFNAASSEVTTQTQYIEIANTTGGDISLLNWTVDDEDADGPNTLPNVTLGAFEIAVICGCSATDFQGAFGTGFTVISILDNSETMFNMSNSPSATSEIIYLRNSSGILIDSVNYDDTTPWPTDPGGFSAYLDISKSTMNETSNNDGANWSLSSSGTNGAFQSTIFGVWNAVEEGSPGNIQGDTHLPVELTSFTAVGSDGQVSLKWVTQSELNNQGFVLERSTDKNGIYQTIASYEHDTALRGAGNSSSTINYSYIDETVFNGNTYWYKLIDVDFNGVRTSHPVISAVPHVSSADIGIVDNSELPKSFALKGNYPNPFNPETTISFDIPETENDLVNVNLSVYNMLGQQMITLINEPLAANSYQAKWYGKDSKGSFVPTGIYFYMLKTENYVSSHKMMLIK